MNKKLQVENYKLKVPDRNLEGRLSVACNFQPSTFNLSSAFTLVEVMVVVVLLSLIVIALMAVFSSTQAAFRASVTQTDIQEGGRATMDLITQDLKEMSPSFGTINGAVNFCVTNNGNLPLYQPLIASSNVRTNLQERFFVLSRENQTWTGTGYAVITNSIEGNLYSLYRFYMTTNVSAFNAPAQLYTNFLNISYTNSPPWSHLIDGVVGLRISAFDRDGALITNGMTDSIMKTNPLPNLPGEPGYIFYSNALPASVEIEMATLEDRALQRAEVVGVNSLTNQAGRVHIFRQRVSIPNVDPSAYQ